MKTNINQFLKQHKANEKLALEASEKIINATVLQMYKNIIDRTPVGNPALWSYPAPKGYDPGTLKASWSISFGSNMRNTKGQFTSGSQMTNAGGLSLKINGSDTKQTISIYNNQPYAQRVENGWSTQAPQGMMRISVAEYTSILGQNTARYRIK